LKIVKKEFLGEVFSYKTEVDMHGNALWTKKIDIQFSHWIYQLREDNRELFKVQYSISSNASAILNKIKEQIGVFDESLIVRAMTIIFISFIDTKRGKTIIKNLENYKESENFKILTEGKNLKKSLYFSALGMRDVEAYSQLTGFSKGIVVKNAIYTVLLIYLNEDEDLIKFWEKEILEKITSIMKAA
jgi:hypothetical protein